MAEMTEVPICVNCINNSAHPSQHWVSCYWKKHEKLDVSDTCKYFNRGGIRTLVPVSNCLSLYVVNHTLYIHPAYAVSYMGHEYIPDIETEELKYDEQDRIIDYAMVLYDANLDLIMHSSLVDGPLNAFINEHDRITKHDFITDEMARRFSAMGIAREMIEERHTKKAA